MYKSQVIQLSRQNKMLRDTVISQKKVISETERLLVYLEEALILSSKKAELIYQKRRERMIEKKKQEELLKNQLSILKKKRFSQANQDKSDKERQLELKISELSMKDFRSRMEEDEIQTIDQIREEEIKELFKSPEPKIFIQKLKSVYNNALMKQRSLTNSSFKIFHPFFENS